ncbi:hypothetical protein BJ965_001350 [Streptomyces luteogriseus]|uniref:Uncharacterized protein n=1 Tax=Streptomyces luteogriseus TaxID=68233 RepID=A0A7W7GGK0_9ACTN|nr:hypothetical protein [Streptomyces luteogriseus]MBB4711468.1 hypothetical protein [Streptomyces luteogriseus]
MISHQHLVEEVASRARLGDADAADAAVHLVRALTVQTRSVQAVTTLDLADRIDDAVMAVGGGSAT